jgi:rubrerythrin
LSKQEKWPETVPLKVKDTVVKDILVEFIRKVDKTSKGDSNDLEAVRAAVDLEAKGAKYYAEIRDTISDPKEKQFFDLLSKIESEHYLSLKDTEKIHDRSAVGIEGSRHHLWMGVDHSIIFYLLKNPVQSWPRVK